MLVLRLAFHDVAHDGGPTAFGHFADECAMCFAWSSTFDSMSNTPNCIGLRDDPCRGASRSGQY